MPHAEKKPGEWSVFDMNAKTPDKDHPGRVAPRMHESRLGLLWALRYNEACYMPEAEARVFLKDKSFKVMNDDDEEVPPLSTDQQQRNLPTVLAPHLCIASLPELTTDALLTRVAQLRGGTRFNSGSTREQIIRFIMDANGAKIPTRNTENVGDGEVDDIGDLEAAAILDRAA